MQALLIVLSLLLSPSAPDAARPAADSCLLCRAAWESHGWCERHAMGYVATIPIRSQLLYETLDAHGHDLDLDTFTCEGCRKAIEAEGFCEQHRIGFVRRQAYFSWLTWQLARAEKRPPAGLACETCRRNATGYGWCERCRAGMIGAVTIREPAVWRRAMSALELLEAASRASARCESCAMAMVTDTQCPVCRITYKEGKPVPPHAPGASPAGP